MSRLLSELREAAAEVAHRARRVKIRDERIPAYASSLAVDPPPSAGEVPATQSVETAAFWLTLNAINYGSGWFPTLNKRPGQSGYHTVAAGLQQHFAENGAWSADELQALTGADLARTLSQDPRHELMGLFAGSLNDLGRHVAAAGGFAGVIDRAGRSAASLVDQLAAWDCFADTSTYDDLTLPFLKRAQIAAADLHRARVTTFDDLHHLTMFADNLVPHVLRLDGVLAFDPHLVDRINRGELLEHGSSEEVEIRACALHAVELIVASHPTTTAAAQVDQVLWLRGQGRHYKASPRHRSRCTAY